MSKLDRYLRTDIMPTFICPGCTHGTAWQSLIRAIDDLGLNQNKTAMVCAIGCAGKLPTYMDFPSLRTPHGRALSYATGLKMSRPELNVIVFMGDGDATAIGGNHLVHAARRNINLTAIIANNQIYGMTGGQYAPTTQKGDKASTAPFGMVEPDVNIEELVIGAGASFFGRGDAYYVKELPDLFSKAIDHKGFSVVEVLTTCPTQYGRRNNYNDAAELLKTLKEITISKKQAENLPPEDQKNKVPRGVLYKEDRPEFIDEYDRITNFKEGDK